MIPFDQIDKALEQIGQDRAWLAKTTGRSAHSIRCALAPNAKASNRSPLLQRVLSEAIERQIENEAATKAVAEKSLPERQQLVLRPTEDEYEAWSRAQARAGSPTLRDWAVDTLNESAATLASLTGVHGRGKTHRATYPMEEHTTTRPAAFNEGQDESGSSEPR